MASGSDWIKNETDKRLKAYLASKNTVVQPQGLQAVEFITFTKPDKSEGKTKSGFIVKTIPQGSIEKEGWGFRLNNSNTYVVYREKERLKNIDTQSPSGHYILLYDNSTFDIYIAKSTKRSIQQIGINGYLIAGLTISEQSQWDDFFVQFSPDGKHIVIIYEFAVLDGSGNFIGRRFKWGWALNWSINSHGSFFNYTQGEQKEVSFTTANMPICSVPAAPAVPGPAVITTGSVVVTYTFEDDPDTYFGNTSSQSVSIGWDFNTYIDLHTNLPKLNIVGNWESSAINKRFFRLKSSSSTTGSNISYTYGAITFDGVSGLFYRLLTVVNSLPPSTTQTYLINGITGSFGPPHFPPTPGAPTLSFLGSNNFFPIWMESYPQGSGGLPNPEGSWFAGFIPTYAYTSGRDTVQGSFVPFQLQHSPYPSIFLDASFLATAPADMASDDHSLDFRTGHLLVNPPSPVTVYYFNLNRILCTFYSINGADPQSSINKSNQVTWSSGNTSFTPPPLSIPQTTGLLFTPSFSTSGNTNIVFGSGLGFSPNNTPYSSSGTGTVGWNTGFFRGQSYYSGWLGYNTIPATAFYKNKLNSPSNTITTSLATVKSNVDKAAIQGSYITNREYIFWNFGTNDIDYLSNTETQVVSDHTLGARLVSDEILVLENVWGSSTMSPNPPKTPPFQTDLPNVWNQSLTPTFRGVKVTNDSQRFQSFNYDVLETVTDYSWNDSNDTPSPIRASSGQKYDNTLYTLFDWYVFVI